MKKIIHTENAPAAIGPYSQANEINGTIYVSGQLPLIPGNKDFAGETIEEQTRQSLTNAKAILEEAGYAMTDVVKVTVLLDDITEFAGMNGVYGEFFTENYPARAAFEVAKLPMAAKVEIEMIAAK